MLRTEYQDYPGGFSMTCKPKRWSSSNAFVYNLSIADLKIEVLYKELVKKIPC